MSVPRYICSIHKTQPNTHTAIHSHCLLWTVATWTT